MRPIFLTMLTVLAFPVMAVEPAAAPACCPACTICADKGETTITHGPKGDTMRRGSYFLADAGAAAPAAPVVNAGGPRKGYQRWIRTPAPVACPTCATGQPAPGEGRPKACCGG